MSQSDQARSIETLKKEYEQLNERKVKAETQLEEAERQLRSLQAEAESEFGTSDIDELSKKLEQMEAKNEQDRREYQALLDKIAADLKQVEQNAPANPS